jgi:hypothetical protein
MSFVKAGFHVPPRTIVAGIPARIVRGLSDGEIAWKSEGTGTTSTWRSDLRVVSIVLSPRHARRRRRKRSQARGRDAYALRLQRIDSFRPLDAQSRRYRLISV